MLPIFFRGTPASDIGSIDERMSSVRSQTASGDGSMVE
jgi:hypothetical protein